MKVQRRFLGCSLSSHPLKGVGVPAQVIIERMTFPFSASIPVERYEAAARKTDAAFAAIVAEAPWVLDVPQKAKALAEENASRRSKFKRFLILADQVNNAVAPHVACASGCSADGQGLVYFGTLGHVMLEWARFSIADTGRILSILAGYCFISGHVMIIGTTALLQTFAIFSRMACKKSIQVYNKP